MAKKLIDRIVCQDDVGQRHEVLLFQTITKNRNTKGERVERAGVITARLADQSAVVRIGPDTFRVVWSGKEIKRVANLIPLFEEVRTLS